MKRLLIGGAALLALSLAASPAFAGADLTWSECVTETSTQTLTFTNCGIAPTKNIKIFVTLTPPVQLANFTSAELKFDFQQEGVASLDPFWRFDAPGSGGCNRTALSVRLDADNLGLCGFEENPWGFGGGEAVSGSAYTATGNVGHLFVAIARPSGFPYPLETFGTYYMCHLQISNINRATCAGCGGAVAISLRSLRLYEDGGGSTLITDPGLLGRCVTLNSASPASCTPMYTIAASAGPNGSIGPSGNVVVAIGDNQGFTITPSAGYVVADVLVDSGSVGATTSYTFTNVEANHTIAATFKLTPMGNLHCNDANGMPLTLGATVTVLGVVTANFPTGANSRLYLRDATGGINVFGALAPQFCGAVGDSVLVTGTMAVFNGLAEIAAPGLALSVLGTAAAPAPLLLTPSQVNATFQGDNCEPNESRLVQVRGVFVRDSVGGMPGPGATFAAFLRYRLIRAAADSTTNFCEVRVTAGANNCGINFPLVGHPIPVGAVDVTGILSQVDTSDPRSGGYQVWPRGPADVSATFYDATSGPLGDTGVGLGVAWADYDRDGDLDLYLTNYGSANKLLRNDGGTWVNMTSGPLGGTNVSGGAVWGDYDNDGDLDLYLANQGQANQLFRNDGGTWVDATSGPLGDTAQGRGVAWGDYDNDGDLDLYLANYGQANKLFANNAGTWVDATGGPLGNTNNGHGVAWGDYDNDGDLDLYLANEAQANQLFRNDGGTFVDATSGPLGDTGNGYGVAWGDYDNDGDLDLYLANSGQANRLFRNDGGTFVDATSGPLGDTGPSSGVAWGDYDNDGDLDLYIAEEGQANKLLRNEGGGVFADATSGPLGDTGIGTGVAWGDYDNDGDLDLYLANYGQANRLFRNDNANGNHWLQVNLQGYVSNRSGVGARVKVVAGGLCRIEEVSGGSGFLSQNSLTAEFGLGASTTIDSLIVRWPSGIVWDTAGVAVDQRLTLIERLESPLLLGIGPDHGGNLGPVTLTISGWGIQGGATARLTRSGQSDIAGTAASVAANGRGITATFDLAGKVVGAWNVVVTNPDLGEGTLANAFTIELDAAPQLRVDLLGSWAMRPDRRRAFDIVIENQGNSNLLSVPLWISNIPASATVEPDFAITAPPQAGGEPDWSTAPLTFGAPGGRYLALVIPRVPPGVTVRRIYLTVPNSVTEFLLDVAVAPAWAGGALRSCLVSGGVISASTCVGAQLAANDSYLDATPGIQALSGIGLWAKIAWQCEGAASPPAAFAKSEQVLDFMQQAIAHSGVPSGCEVPLAPRWQDTLRVRVVTSLDPNDKLGADGLGPNRQIGSQQLLPYVIRFENKDSTGVVPAQSIVVTDVLDASKLNLTTVSLGPIKFGRRPNGTPWTVDPGSGLTSYTTDVDLRPQQDLLVRVWANLDQATGVLGWSLTAIDPATGQLPDDPFVGFLPRNVTPPEGEGALFFTVSPKPGLSAGTAITNRATINFDGVALQTPLWSNTLDDTGPDSQVLPLAANQDSARFTVRWAAVGPQPDLRDYSVYVSEDGGAYRPWRLQTTATADTLVTSPGRQYRFYSLARDSSGNLETVPAGPDRTTTVASPALAVGSSEVALALEGALPNPTTGPARVWLTLPSLEPAELEMMDVTGRRVMRRDVGAMGPGRHSVDVSTAARRPGIYFLRLTQGGRELRARMAVVR